MNDERLSVSQLKRAVAKQHASDAKPGFTTLFRPDGTDLESSEVRFSPVSVKLAELTDDERAAMKAELVRLLTMLG